MAKYWIGGSPEARGDATCDLCNSIRTDKFIDGRTHSSMWAIMCNPCYLLDGVGLGVGKGQLYERQPDMRWLKTSG